MAKIKKKIRKTKPIQYLNVNVRKPLTPREKIKALHSGKRVALGDLSKRTVSVKQVRREVNKVHRKAVLPKYSKLSPFSCRKKKAEVRRDVFAMRASGAGPRKNLIHKNRFTVRC